jgi:DNA-binding HxlR family transcriptional regulator
MAVTGRSKPGGLAAKIRERHSERGDLYARACPSREVLSHVTSRWGALVLVILLERMHRFSELRRAVAGVSEKMLAQTLRELELDGFLLREVFPVVPPRVEYTLTRMGREVAEHVEVLADWIEINLPHVLKARTAVGTKTRRTT